MKKVISIVLAVALVLSMSVCAFAATKPTNPTGTSMGLYYAELLNEGATKDEVVAEFISDVEAGIVTHGMLENLATVFVTNSQDQALAMEVVQEVQLYLSTTTTTETTTESTTASIGDVVGGVVGDVTGAVSDVIDGAGDAVGSADGFLDTILGVLGGLGDILFGSGGEGSDDPTDDNDNPWGDEEMTGNNGDSQVPNGGDTSVVAVATIALVAGAALVLTRKKNEDAE